MSLIYYFLAGFIIFSMTLKYFVYFNMGRFVPGHLWPDYWISGLAMGRLSKSGCISKGI